MQSISPLFLSSWQRMWRGLGVSGDGLVVFHRLLARYAEPERKYHTQQHLSECLAGVDTVAHLALQPAEVEAALWFHDAVYALQRHDNEVQSADLARAALTAAQVPHAVVERVAALVLATQHSAAPQEPDAQLVVDVDLAILGAAPLRFAEYQQQIRKEYAWVPEAVFASKRREVLQSFLQRPRIYSTAAMAERLEAQARANLAQALA